MLNVYKARQAVKILHPLVRDAYLKKEVRPNQREEDVLVIEALNQTDEMAFGKFDNSLYDLVVDLKSVKQQAERQAGSIDRVDICIH